MEQVISPWFIYFINIANKFAFFSVAFSVIGLIVVILVFIVSNTDDDVGYKMPVKYPIIAAIILLLAMCLPNKNTLIEMYIANELTYNKIESIVRSGRDVKNSIKKDIIDIINEINKKKK